MEWRRKGNPGLDAWVKPFTKKKRGMEKGRNGLRKRRNRQREKEKEQKEMDVKEK